MKGIIRIEGKSRGGGKEEVIGKDNGGDSKCFLARGGSNYWENDEKDEKASGLSGHGFPSSFFNNLHFRRH